MKTRSFAEEQIIGILKKGNGGMKMGKIFQEHGICEQTYYRWKATYGEMEVSEARQVIESWRQDYNEV